MKVLPLGAFVWTNFPFGYPPEARARPGPLRHIAYHLGSDAGLALLAYTSSGPWRGAALGRPPGIVEFDGVDAGRLNQKPFHIDLRTLAKVTLTQNWFPDWADGDHGVVAVAAPDVQHRILEAARLLRTRAETIEVRGIGSPTTAIRTSPKYRGP